MPPQDTQQNAHDYMPPTLAAQLPALYSTEGQGDEAIVYAHYFTPDSSWDWYATEYDPAEGLCFGLVSGSEVELGYFSIGEMRFARGPWGLHIERDVHWTPTALRVARQRHEGNNGR